MNTKKQIAFFLLLWLQVCPAFGQNLLIGKVKDKRTTASLSDVQVYWRGKKEFKQITNKEGIYTITKNSEDSILIFEKPGKKRIGRLLSKEILDSIFWELDIIMENEDISSSTASHWEQSVYEIPASTVIITREEIERNGYMTLTEILENVPGFYAIDHRSESDVTLGVRGFWAPFNRNVMIQMNGVNMLSERQNDFPLNKINVPVEAIERVEIVRGPLSVIYGAGAFFGVINIITLDPRGDGTEGHLSTAFGTQNTFQQTFRYSMFKDGLMMSLNAMNTMRDGFQQPWDAMISDSIYNLYANLYSVTAPFDTTTADQYQGQIVNPERYSRRHQSVNFALRYRGFSADVHYARSNFGFSFLHPGPASRNDYISNSIYTQFGYSGTAFRERISYEFTAAHTFSLVDAEYRYFLEDSYTPGEDKVASLRTEANARWQITENEKKNRSVYLSSGLAYTNNYQNASIYNAAEFNLRNWYIGLSPNTSLQTTAVYSQLDVKLNNLQLVAGGRLEQQSAYSMLSAYNLDYQFQYSYTDANQNVVDDTVFLEPTIIQDRNDLNSALNFIPRLAVLYSLMQRDSSAHYLRLMYGGAIKQASVVDNAADVMMPLDGPNRPYLRPERIRTYEFGYTYNFEAENYKKRERKALMINLNVFRNDLLDLITRRAEIINGNYVTRSTNGDRLVTNGGELITNMQYSLPRSEGQKAIIFNLNADATLQRTADVNDDNREVSFSPNFLSGVSAGIRIEEFGGGKRNGKLRAGIGSLELTVGMNYVGAMRAYYEPDTLGTALNPILPYYIGDDTDGYARWSLNFRINDIRLFREKNGGFYANCRVVNLFDKQYYYPTYSINSWADRGMLGRPRQILITIGYKF